MNSQLIISANSGDKNGSFTIGAPEHTGRKTIDYGTVYVKAKGCPNQPIRVLQTGKAPFIVFDQESITIDKDGGTCTITGKSNCQAIKFSWSGDHTDNGIGEFDTQIKINNSVNTYQDAEIPDDPGLNAAFTFALTLKNIPANTKVGEDIVAQLNAYGSLFKGGLPEVQDTAHLTVTQNSVAPSLSVEPSTINLDWTGDPLPVNVYCNLNWTVE